MFGHLPAVFDSAAMPQRDRFALAREEYGRKALNVELDLLDDTPFHIRMNAAEFGNVRVAVIKCSPYRVSRTRKLIADGDDLIGLVLPLAGQFKGVQCGEEFILRPGQASTLVANRIGEFGAPRGGAFLTIRAAPEIITSFAPEPDRFRVGAVLQPSRRAMGLIRAYLSALNSAGQTLATDMRAAAGRHLAELAALAYSGADLQPKPSADGTGLRAARTAAALSHMRDHFTSPGYTIASCACHIGTSVRQLQVMLEQAGTSFSETVKGLRLDHAHSLLADPSNTGMRVTDIALECGYSDISHFNRQFRAHFGESPTSARAAR